MRDAVRSFAETQAVDLWQAEGAPYFEALRGLAGVRKVLMAHNVESQIWERYHETEARPLRKWYIARQWRKFERFEREAFAEATRVVAVSDEDAALVRGRFGAERVEVVDNGIDRAFFGSVEPARDTIASSSSAASIGGPTSTRWTSCWTASSRRCWPPCRRPGSTWWAATRPGRWRGGPATCPT